MRRWVLPTAVAVALGLSLAQATPAEPGCHPGIKLGGHLQPGWSPNPAQVCQGIIAPTLVNCFEGSGSDMIVQGDLNVSYTLYFIAADVSVNLGIQEAAFGLRYNETPGAGVDIFDFVSCADNVVLHNNWPASGGGIELAFGACQGTVAEPNDFHQSSVILGAAYVYAYSDDHIEILEPNPDQDHAYVRDCEGDITVVPDGLGQVGGTATLAFGNEWGWDPCQGDFYAQAVTCCLPDTCASLTWTCCLSAGGILLGYVPCSECSIPTERATWSALKTHYR